jgi:hypothetical protein
MADALRQRDRDIRQRDRNVETKIQRDYDIRHVPDRRSQDLEVVVVRRIIDLGTGNLEWGGNGKGLRKGRSVYE